MTLNIIQDMREALAVAESIAAANRFDPETAVRLFSHLERDLTDIEVLLEHGLAHTPALIAIGGPRVQHETPPSPRPRRFAVIQGRQA